jgi:hypothetical protein
MKSTRSSIRSRPERSLLRSGKLLCGLALVATVFATGCSASGDFARASYATGAAAPPMGPAPVTLAMESDREEAYGGDAATTGMKMAPDSPMPAPAPAGYPMPAKQRPADAGPSSDGAAPVNPAGPFQGKRAPILIYTADFTMSVFEVERSLDTVESLAKDAGGYLSRRDDRSITVRVPAEKFQDLIVSIEKVGDVVHRNVVSEDVTAEYRDLEVQLQNMLALRSRFEKLLEKAQKVEEALSIERELGRITGEIERIKGRLKLLTDLAQYSTITVSFQPRGSSEVQEGPFVLPLPWVNDVGLRRLMSL